MAGNTKQGGKNKKIGRHARNPSSKQQASRTARNKSKRKATGVPASYPKLEAKPVVERVCFTGEVRRARGDFLAIHDGKIIEIGTFSDCVTARKESCNSPMVQIFHRDISTLIPVGAY